MTTNRGDDVTCNPACAVGPPTCETCGYRNACPASGFVPALMGVYRTAAGMVNWSVSQVEDNPEDFACNRNALRETMGIARKVVPR